MLNMHVNAMMTLRTEFPELSPKMFLASAAYSLGLDIPQISELTGSSNEATRKALQRSKAALGLGSLASLRGVFLMRAMFTVLNRCGGVSQ
ncbi:hypothetical protein J8Z82_14860 [Yersinia enterocolitica]|uniref:hypothetical protein n=1 Tax=Yersinia enterocolitica TaxID=630 RepID=UPI001C8D0875|nr:hypothetical protein [Yersinia enterocolitica]MBX9486162.1 hypothetical protein [Yersinia enterocolitica]MBX9493054.1 hypothetical protein [Yersinia enterocolitica]